MEFTPIERPVYQVEVICKGYLLSGSFMPIGSIVPYLNDVGRRFVPFQDATLTALNPTSPLPKLQQPTLMVGKPEIAAVSLIEPEAAQAAQLLATSYRTIVYTGGFVIEGDLHMGVEDSRTDFLSDSKADFCGMTDVTIYPLQASSRQPQRQSPLVIINRSAVLFYHAAPER